MPSEKQAEASRANGARSRGPITEEGKRRSSQNARKHGLTAQQFLLGEEEEPQFHAFFQALEEVHRPVDHLERSLVARIAEMQVALTRARRCERDLIYYDECNMAAAEARSRMQLPHMKPTLRSRVIKRQLDDINLLNRYASSLQRQLERNVVLLESLQKKRAENEVRDARAALDAEEPAPLQQAGPQKTAPLEGDDLPHSPAVRGGRPRTHDARTAVRTGGLHPVHARAPERPAHQPSDPSIPDERDDPGPG